MSWDPAAIRQHNTHRSLARTGEPGSFRADAKGLDAIIVPGTRPAAYLDHAATLARAANCPLVVLCSDHLHGREVKEHLDYRSFSGAIVIDVPKDYEHPLLHFPRLLDMTHPLPAGCDYPVTHLSMKRNVGLVLAKMLGWERIFFLDDDIRDIAYPDLQRTVNMLGSFSVAGMWVTEFQDVSIVCHANRIIGGSQDAFVSGAALAVDCRDDIGFFPDIYKGDWLFFFDAASKGKLGNSYLKATQLYYYPFANAEEAARQEFGDLITEGLYALLHLGVEVEQATSTYWSKFLEARRNFLENTLSRVGEARADMQAEITASLHSALKCMSGITPDLCARYVEAWREDLRAWKLRWAGIREMPSADAALAELRLVPMTADSPKRILHPQNRVTLTPVAGPVTIPQLDTLPLVAEPDGATLPLVTMPDGATRRRGTGLVNLFRRRRLGPPPALGEGVRPGRQLIIEGASGIQVGDNSVQNNYFYGFRDRLPPPREDGLPYRGLSVFEESDREIFFGRDDAITEVLDRLATSPSGIFVVSGASGSGKSSLLRAGVIPRLLRDGLPDNPGAQSWPCLLFTPGPTPLDELAAQLAVLAGISVENARESLTASPEQVGRLARQAVIEQSRQSLDQVTQPPVAQQRLLLIIDQFEQLFTQCPDESERRAFITTLESAASSPERHAHVVLGVRADFEDECAAYPQLAAPLRECYRVGLMTERELELAITEPAKQAGVRVERELVNSLLAESRGSAPWLSFALAGSWHVHTGNELTLADYYQAGRVEAAVATAAQRAYDTLTNGQRDAARQVFLQLIRANGDGSDTAVPAARAELDMGKDPRDVGAVLDAFAAERLLTLTRSSVEISHNVLLSAWPLLRDDWLADKHRLDNESDVAVRALVDMEERQGQHFVVVTGPGGLRSERQVTWAGSPGRRLLLPSASVGAISDPSALADAVDQGRATDREVTEYGQLLFEAAVGQKLWGQLLQAARGRPYLELAIRAADGADQAAMQALRWETLHDGTSHLAMSEATQDGTPAISIVRVVLHAGQPSDAGSGAGLQPVDRVPRVLFAVGGSSSDLAAQANEEITGIVRELEQANGSIHPRVLKSASLASLREELSSFRPDALHLMGHWRESLDGQTGLQALSADAWAGPEPLLDVFQSGRHIPRIVVLSFCPGAPAPDAVGPLPLAARMVAGGIPVVITMPGNIPGAACRVFTAHLMDGAPLVRALAGGRLAERREDPLSAPQWTLPTAFLAENVRSGASLVKPGVARVVRDRIHNLALNQDAVPSAPGEFMNTMDRLLDGSDPLNVLFAYRPDHGHSYDDYQLLRELGAHAVRLGVLPVLLGPYNQDPPSSLSRLAVELTTAIGNIRSALGLRNETKHLLDETAHPDASPDYLAEAACREFANLVKDLPETDPVRARANGQPRVVLLCHAVDGWLDTVDSRLGLIGPMGLSRTSEPVPVVLTGADVGVLREARLSQWPAWPWISAIPVDLPGSQDLVEKADEIRTLIAARDYQQAVERLARLAAEDPRQAEQIRLELGFVTWQDPDRRIVATAWAAAATGHDVQQLLAGNDDPPSPTQLGTTDTPTATVLEPAVVQQPQAPASATAARRSAQQSGAALEQATVDLFERFFTVDPDAILGRLRRQAAGPQFGHDIELECTVAGSPGVRCHVECKNLDHPVTIDDIGGKLAQQKHHYRDTQVDHWILISPHHDVNNELRGMLDIWDEQGEYPFSVQVWSPETKVREMFALEPAVYQAVYGRPPTGEEAEASARATGFIRQKLAPRLRVDTVWRRYLEQPGAFCFVNENSRDFDGLYGLHLPLWAASEDGAVLNGTLLKQVSDWARDGGNAPMLLLADFGEGKSLFTYCLTRRLSEEFRAAPDGALFPLRIPLREFREAGSARGLLERRLGEIGATLADWRTLNGQVRTLAILDGFDEMSADLSPGTITANLRDIRSCLTELSSSKVLVTSRQRVLDGSRDWKRTLSRLRQPLVMRIVPGPRRQRVQYLEKFATDEASARKLANLRRLYDPIGLAAKPLFLEMIKGTLRDLPDDTFSETILYETYIDKSLRTKAELLADPDELLIDDELVENLKEILEEVALRLQEANASYLYLRDYRGRGGEKIAELLWRMRDQAVPRGGFALAAQDDAANRVGIRSLLKAVPAPDADRWPVDFFHRSMREYFVARSIAHSLTTDSERARPLLSAAPLLPEIAHFGATLLRSQPDSGAVAILEELARSATIGSARTCLGGNALTLLHGTGGRLAGQDWSGMRLDHARLQGADLRDARFAGSSLRYANLDNANLEGADLTGADLEGVRLEETSQVLAVTALGADRIIAAYEDRSLREWRSRPVAGWESRVVVTLDHRADRLQVTPSGLIMASGEGMLSVLDVAESADSPDDPGVSDGTGSSGMSGEMPAVRCAFRTSSRCRAAILGERTALFAEEEDGGQILATWLDMITGRALKITRAEVNVSAWAQLDGELCALATPTAINVFWQQREAIIDDPAVTCLAVRADGSSVLLAAGHHDGSVSLTQVSPGDDIPLAPQWRRPLHDGPVTDILLDAEEQAITGSTDRSVRVTPLSAIRSDSPDPGNAKSPVQRLHLTLRCKGARLDGVRTEREQEKLRMYAEFTFRT